MVLPTDAEIRLSVANTPVDLSPQILNKRTVQNPKYANVKSTINTGASAKNVTLQSMSLLALSALDSASCYNHGTLGNVVTFDRSPFQLLPLAETSWFIRETPWKSSSLLGKRKKGLMI